MSALSLMGRLGAQAEEVEGKLLQTTSHSETLSIGNVKSTDATCDRSTTEAQPLRRR